MQPNYYELKINAAEDVQDILIAELAELNFDGFEQHDKQLIAYAENIESIDTANLQAFLSNMNIAASDWNLQLQPNKNWNVEWEKNFEAVTIGNKIHVHALFHQPQKETQFNIAIQPKMSFGTGHHSTTKLMLEALLNLDVQNKTVLDMGCGTAVLAIYASMAGAKNVLAIDNENWAYENAIENCEINNCKNIEVKLGDEKLLQPESGFDIIVSNITKNFNLANLPLYNSLLNQNGIILLSGFYEHDAPDFFALAASLNLKLTKQTVDKNWTMLQLAH